MRLTRRLRGQRERKDIRKLKRGKLIYTIDVTIVNGLSFNGLDIFGSFAADLKRPLQN